MAGIVSPLPARLPLPEQGSTLYQQVLAVVSAGVAAITRTRIYVRSFDVASTLIAALTSTQLIPQVLAATTTLVAAISPQFLYARTLAAVTTFTAATSRLFTFTRTLAATTTATAVMLKAPRVVLEVSSTLVVGLFKGSFRLLAVASSMAASFVRKVSKFLTIGSTHTPTLAPVFQEYIDPSTVDKFSDEVASGGRQLRSGVEAT